VILIDTHVLIWLVNGEERLGLEAREAIASAAAQGGVHVSAITAWEVALLAEKGRLALGRDATDWLGSALSLRGLVVAPIDAEIAMASVRLPGAFHSDPADRFIVATARHQGWPLITADRAILTYAASGHVNAMDAAR
jgi:PIN domain nuclease of toxin-antitoxin system